MTPALTDPDHPDLPATAYAVLGLMTMCPETSGYDLKNFADQSISHFYWSPAKSQVYAELRRLERHGLISVREVEQETRPDKRLYALTPSGRAALQEWLDRAGNEHSLTKDLLMLKLFFGASGDTGLLIKRLRARANEARAKLASFRELHAHLSAKPETLFAALTLSAGILHMEADAQWADESAGALEQRGPAPSRTH
jgi:DNA-binding PadR family transcriptional regulator